MKRAVYLSLVLGVMIGLAASAVRAAETPSASPVSSTTTATPQVSTTDGSIATLDLQAPSPSLKVTMADGKSMTVAVDPKATSVWQGAAMIKLEQLKVGQSVKVRHTTKDGKEVAKSIQLVEAPKSAAAPATGAPSQAH